MQKEKILLSNPKYVDLLGSDQTLKMLDLFGEIESGKYDKNEITQWQVKGLKHPLYLRSIRADMQSFVNTFIDPYLTKKEYMNDAKFVIDAGGNIGCTAALYANWWPNATIICIEPDSGNLEMIKMNCEPYAGIKWVHGGVWNKDATLRIEAGQEDGFVVREVEGNNSTVNPENLTIGFSIDKIMKDNNALEIDFLKMNIEGSEKEVFSEAYENWLPKTTAMLIELHDGKNAGCAKAVFNTVNKYDFAVADTAPYGVLFAKESVYRAWYANWYKEHIYLPNINKSRFPEFYLDKEKNRIT